MLMYRKLSSLLRITGILVGGLVWASPIQAQVSGDGSLSTTVEQVGADSTINGGNRSGDNLFHSFSDFSVPESGSATFMNDLDVVNIFNRVTGGNISQIDGLIEAQGGANLFLINPAGIIFGENARLDIGGSFYGSTADSILFPDGVEFSAVNIDIEPILTVNAPIGLNLRSGNSGTIINRSVVNSEPDEFGFSDPIGLTVSEGESITLEANQIRLESGLLTAPGGSIELKALGEIAIAGNNLDFALNTSSGEGNGGRIEINSSNGINFTNANLRADSFDSGSGGQIKIFAQDALVFEDSTLSSSADSSGQGGDITLESGTSIELIDTRIDTAAFGDQRSGDIQITAFDGGTINFIGRQATPAQILADAFGSGEGLEDNQTGGDLSIIGGDITIDNYQLISLVNGEDFLNPNTQGNGGDITIGGNNITITNNSTLETQTLGDGAAGNVTIDGDNITISNNSTLETQTLENGGAGNVTINGDNITISNSTLETQTLGIGAAGNVTINGQSLTLDNSVIEASNRPPSTVSEDSVGGNINLQLSGIVSLRNDSSILTEAENNANGGNISINSQFIVAFPADNNGNDIVTRAEAGRGGDINITTESIFNLENRTSQPNNGTNDLDASSQLGLDGNVLINTISINKIEGIIDLSVDLIDAEKSVAYSCQVATGTSGLVLKGKGGIPPEAAAPLVTENIYLENKFSSPRETIKNTDISNPEQSLLSVETNSGKINLATGAIVKENGVIALVNHSSLIEQNKVSNLSNCL